jgi:hypothetical protein
VVLIPQSIAVGKVLETAASHLNPAFLKWFCIMLIVYEGTSMDRENEIRRNKNNVSTSSCGESGSALY